MSRFLRRFVLLSLLAFPLMLPRPVYAETVTVFAAASLKDSLDQIGRLYESRSGNAIRFSFTSSAVLAKQIENGAPADLFASADLAWMNYLDDKNLIRRDTRKALLGNRLVVIAPRSSPLQNLELTADNFTKWLAGQKIAAGDVNSVPAGIYAKAAFVKLGLWPVIEPHLAQAENVRAAMAFVARNEAALGVVYQTDAKADPAVKIVATLPAGSHDPIIYPFALTASAQATGAAADFLRFLQTPEAGAVFAEAGFLDLAH